MWDPGLGNHWYGSTVCFKTAPGRSTHYRTQRLRSDLRVWFYFLPLPKHTSKHVLLLSQQWWTNTNDVHSSEETLGRLSNTFYSLKLSTTDHCQRWDTEPGMLENIAALLYNIQSVCTNKVIEDANRRINRATWGLLPCTHRVRWLKPTVLRVNARARSRTWVKMTPIASSNSVSFWRTGEVSMSCLSVLDSCSWK